MLVKMYINAHYICAMCRNSKSVAKKVAIFSAETGQFLQLTRIKSWDNIEKIGIIPTDYKKLVEDKR